MDFCRIAAALMLLITVHLNLANGEDKIPLVTQTVYGFLDFTTTMGNTVMVFSPQSAPPLVLPEVTSTPQPIIKTKPVNSEPEPTETDISPTKSKPITTTNDNNNNNNNNSEEAATTTTTTTTSTSSSSSSSSSSSTAANAEEKTIPLMDKTKTTTATTKSVAVKKKQNNTSPTETTTTTTTTNNVIVNSEKDTTPLTVATHPHQSTSPIPIENDLYSPEYNLLSRQPPQFVEESFRVISLRQPPSHNKLGRPSPSPPPVVVTPEKNTVTSVVATKNSSTRTHKNKKHKVRPSSTLQVLKTAAPISAKSSSGKRASASRSSSSSSSRKSGKKGSHRTTTTTIKPQVAENVVTVRSNTRTKPKSRKSKHKSSSHGSKPKYSTTTTATIQEPTSKRPFRPKTPNHNPIDLDNNNNSNNNNNNNNNNLHITKLNRAPGRWQYKTTAKPRVTIRKPLVEGVNNAGTLAGVAGVAGAAGLANISLVNAVTESLFNDNVNNNFIINNQSDLESSGSQSGGAIVNNIDGDGGNSIGPDGKQKFFTETINVEISTPADFKDTYYEIATIKKPFIFQAGILKKTRYITVTSTIEKYLTSEVGLEPRNEDEPLTENILATTSQTSHADNLLQGSITTLSPIYVNNDAETPLLETITDSFSIVNKKLKTQILPVIKVGMENETSYNTLIQTIDVTSLITITKTTSPLMENKDGFNGFKDFVDNLDEAGSEINLDLEFGDENNHESNGEERKFKNSSDLDQLMVSKVNKTILPVLPITADIPSFVQSTLPLPTVITNSRPVIKLETLWESYVIPVTNGQSTSFRTLSKAKGVVEKTEYVLDATTVPVQAPPILPPSTLNPFLLPIQQQQQQQLLQQYQTITSPVVQQTIVTQTQSKILKLTFGAKTAYTTLYSTQVVPTLQTMYVTTSLPVQASANPFPGFFPPGYNPFAYLG